MVCSILGIILNVLLSIFKIIADRIPDRTHPDGMEEWNMYPHWLFL